MLSIPEDAYIKHMSPGRLRLKVPSKKGEEGFFSSVQAELSQWPGVERTEVNALTGSILIIHSIEESAILELASRANLLSPEKGQVTSPNFHREVTRTIQSVDRRVQGFFGGGVNLGAVAFMTLGGYALYQVGRGNLTAIPWFTALWYALNLFLKSKPERDEGIE
jgi:hypothetical protein